MNIKEYTGRNIIVDTDSPLLYIGKLVKVGQNTLELEETDVHDLSKGISSKELYLIDAKKIGIKKNRKYVIVMLSKVVSVSLLDDIIEY